MRYSIITPTQMRSSLWRLCESIDKQTNSDWEHLVAVNGAALPENENPKRIFHSCVVSVDKVEDIWKVPNVCRWEMWDKAQGEYIIYLDDDNYFADDKVLESLEIVTQPWAVWAMSYDWNGPQVTNVPAPPDIGAIDTNSFMHRRECGRWPKTDSRSADRDFVTQQLSKFPFQTIIDRPLVVYL